MRAKRTTEISGVFLFLGDQHPGYLVWLSTAGGDHQRAVFGATADALAQVWLLMACMHTCKHKETHNSMHAARCR